MAGAASGQMPWDRPPGATDKEGRGTINNPWRSPPAPQSGDLLAVSALAAINDHRRLLGLRELRPHAGASERARRLALDMAARRVPFGHDGLQARFDSLRGAMELRGAAELLARNRGHANPVAIALQDWKTSGTHRRALQGDYDGIGIGVARGAEGEYYFAVFLVRTGSY